MRPILLWHFCYWIAYKMLCKNWSNYFENILKPFHFSNQRCIIHFRILNKFSNFLINLKSWKVTDIPITFFNGSRVLVSVNLVTQTSTISPWAVPICVKRSSWDSKGPRKHFEHFLHKISVTESKSQTSGLCDRLKCSTTVAIFSAKKLQFWKGQ